MTTAIKLCNVKPRHNAQGGEAYKKHDSQPEGACVDMYKFEILFSRVVDLSKWLLRWSQQNTISSPSTL